MDTCHASTVHMIPQHSATEGKVETHQKWSDGLVSTLSIVTKLKMLVLQNPTYVLDDRLIALAE